MEFGNRLYELRKQKGLSQEELANRLDVTRQTVSKWEGGHCPPGGKMFRVCIGFRRIRNYVPRGRAMLAPTA